MVYKPEIEKTKPNRTKKTELKKPSQTEKPSQNQAKPV
jgi:hypothetical protein